MSPEDQLTILLERFQSHKPSSTDIQEALAELIPGNEEEQADLKKYYEKFKGDMKKVIQCVPGCEKQDLPRLCETIREWIKTEIVEDFPLFQKTQVSDKIVPQKRQQSTRDPKAKARKKAKI
ncbi:hypothetical protein BLNAU_8971 [Blattamonas nauphoetae]|uniref:DNAJC9 HTH domain-containing protein n=1 Tax=Blattamonas nauphoetae TaxID=2049346 RepID=A0ABQ9XWY5_9EUKA|nr:hypothetical protein BLNAU_8971 [Blattamonas nauphoetae]